jgi:hypothetical protein
MMKRSKGPSFTETGTNTRARYLRMCFMARECIHLQVELSTRETFKMGRRTGLAPKLGLMGPNTTADGSRIRNMEWESKNGPMGLFTKAASQMTNSMDMASFGLLVATSIKVITRMIKGRMVSIQYIIKLQEKQLMPNIKMISLKDYTHNKLQAVSFGSLIQNINNTALRFCKKMILSSWKLARFARDSTRKRLSRSLSAH